MTKNFPPPATSPQTSWINLEQYWGARQGSVLETRKSTGYLPAASSAADRREKNFDRSEKLCFSSAANPKARLLSGLEGQRERWPGSELPRPDFPANWL
ncbi:MAG: hypothetical protein LBR11_11055 [Deltaproteobacteria bacterium]|nr:hypothetical protein [Deltaproteobacteria bacterium]